MIRIRHLAAVAAVGLTGAVSAPAALAAPESLAAPAIPEASPATVESEASTISPVAYADRTIREFGAGDDADLQRDTTADARSAITEHDAAPTHWMRTDAQGAAGHVYVTYVNTETHDQLILGVNTTTGMDGDHLVDQAR
ncbi:hypothetical protein BH708_16030 [Brachybacterium sp. P6-10-X1]|uniref:hypothetical protein n=1 Tax=Brachybacterium sp. P6-10-X1 TaxID=1903186 RepID=UPI000971AE7D|nr:hypothetical protein [Brachybacterium sp. P6-10-X1]APX33965.1 hypothetical protein BH708_16030 [Brachybacterium sp. P6-10-X1]